MLHFGICQCNTGRAHMLAPVQFPVTGMIQDRRDIQSASGVALAASFKEFARYADRQVVVLICGGNASPAIRDLLL